MFRVHGKRVRRAVIAVVTCAMAIAACGGDDSDESDAAAPDTTATAESEDTANEDTAGATDTEDTAESIDRKQACAEEGPVLVYGNPPQQFWDTLLPAFQEVVPGVEVETVDLGSEELVQRYLSETSTGARSADIVGDAGVTTWLALTEEGAVRPYTPAIDDLPERATLLPGVFALEFGPAIIVYSTDDFEETTAPGSLADLVALADEFDGRLTTYDISNGYGYAMFHALTTQVDDGWEVLEQLLPATRPEAGAGAMLTKVGQGEYAAAYMMSGLAPSVFEALGIQDVVGWSYAADATTMLPRGIGITESADSPNCAELLVDFALSADGQQAVCESGMYTYRDDLENECADRSLASVIDAVGSENVYYVAYDSGLQDMQDEIAERWRDLAGQ